MLLNEMEIFYHIAVQQSFSKAAERLGVSKSFISKRMTKLEQDLKTRLISRTTRKLTLTEAGKNFYFHCAKIVQESENAYSMLNELRGEPSGLLKISVPPALALNLLAPVFSQFAVNYPDVVLDIQLENRLVDLVKEGYDLALRSAILASSNLIAQKIFTIKNKIYASEEYLQTYGAPKIPADLMQHHFAVYSDAKALGQFKLSKQHKTEIISIKAKFLSNHLALIKQMVIDGTCLAVLPEFMMTQELQNKSLISCLNEYSLPINNLYAIYPDREFMLPKLSVFLKMLKDFLDNIA